MQNNPHSAKYAFFYLLSFFALGFTAIAIGQVIFQLINFAIVETTCNYCSDYNKPVLRFALSSLIVAAPIYYVCLHSINRALARQELSPEAPIRKWLTYLALLLVSAVVIGDLVFTLNAFLEGELTLKFFLKALTIFAIAGGFGSYYVFDLKRKGFQPDGRVKIFGGGFILVVLACLVTAFALVGSPQKARELREDLERVSQLEQISYRIENFYETEGRLPQSLSKLEDLPEEDLQDPVTKEAYEFSLLNDEEYQLCATFAHDNREEKEYWNPSWKHRWKHRAGKQCFSSRLTQRSDDNTYFKIETAD